VTSKISNCQDRLTQSVMYFPLQPNRFAENILLIVQYRYLKSCSGDFYSPESDPPHKIMRYWFYYSIWLGFSFRTDSICHLEMICIGGVPVSKRHFGGAGPYIFYMIHRGGRQRKLHKGGNNDNDCRHARHLKSLSRP